jgi:O-acetyl-ADP-ribose deacetylase (regulator of RNase III)
MVKDDTISKALALQLGDFVQVAPAFVIATTPGDLALTNQVKHVFHVASVAGEPATGYRPIGRIQDCITQCLRKADTLTPAPESILFPLMGTGTGQGNLEETVERLLKAAMTYLVQHNDTTSIRIVYFVAFNELDLAICQKVLTNTSKVTLCS